MVKAAEDNVGFVRTATTTMSLLPSVRHYCTSSRRVEEVLMDLFC